MRQLAGGDHIWFAAETEATPMQLVLISVYDGSTRENGEPPTLEEFKEYVRRRLHAVPLRRRLLEHPLRIDMPYWIEDENFDLDNHIRHIPLVDPGDWDALRALAGTFASKQLDRSRPLWEMHLVTGLDDERFPPKAFAVAQKFHHGQFDGTNLMNLMIALHMPAAAEEDTWSPDPPVSHAELLARGPLNAARRFVKGATAATRILRSLVAKRPEIGGDEHATKFAGATRFAGAITTSERVYETIEFPLADVLAMRKAIEGATVNDVAITIAAGALREYLGRHGELPEMPLRSMAPVSAHQSGEQHEGNRVSMMSLTLFTDEPDPLTRLERTKDSTVRSKGASAEIGVSNVADLLDSMPTNALGALVQGLSRTGLVSRVKMPISGVALTNVPGPREPVFLDGAAMVTGLQGGFLAPGLGLLLIVTSYCDQFVMGFSSTPELLPDDGVLKACIERSFAELRDATGG